MSKSYGTKIGFDDAEKRFFLLVKSGNINGIKELATIKGLIHKPNVDNNTALHIAATEGHTQIVEFLLKAGANKEHLNNDGQTALNYAANHMVYDDMPYAFAINKVAAIATLINSGANKSGIEKSKLSKIVQNEFFVFSTLTQKDNIDYIKSLTAMGVKINPSTEWLKLLENGISIELTEALLESGADFKNVIIPERNQNKAEVERLIREYNNPNKLNESEEKSSSARRTSPSPSRPSAVSLEPRQNATENSLT